MNTTWRFQRVALILSLTGLAVLAIPITTDGKKGPRTTSQATSTSSPELPQTQTAVRPAQTVKIQPTNRATGRGERLRRPQAAHPASAQVRHRALSRYPRPLEQPRPRMLDRWQIDVIDGNTLGYGTDRIRIRGIETPKVSEIGGVEASQRLALLLQEGPVTIIPQGPDKYGRTLADVYVNDQNVADVLRAEGFAKARSSQSRP